MSYNYRILQDKLMYFQGITGYYRIFTGRYRAPGAALVYMELSFFRWGPCPYLDMLLPRVNLSLSHLNPSFHPVVLGIFFLWQPSVP